MVADPRRDHSLRVPRPDLTVSLGIPNACNLCHDDLSEGETPLWAEEQCEKWYGKPEGKEHFAHAIAAGRDGEPEAVEKLIDVARRTNPTQIRPIVRASAVSLLGRFMDDAAIAECFRALESENAHLRLAAVEALENLPVDRVRERVFPLLDDPVRAVRLEAARLLSRSPPGRFSEQEHKLLEQAVQEYIESQKVVGDQAAAHLNLAVIYQNQREAELQALQSRIQMELRANPGRREAIERHFFQEREIILQPVFEEYRTALEIDPLFIPARINLAMLLDQVGKPEEAEKQFRKILEINPELGDAHYSLGLLFAEMGRLEEAVASLKQAGELLQENPRVHYNLGLALQKLGHLEEAEKELMIAFRQQPETLEFLHALAILSSQKEEWDKAIARAKLLMRSDPNNPQWQQFLQSLRELSKQK
jgi:tetratricopeptide (TPR) repeat protein